MKYSQILKKEMLLLTVGLTLTACGQGMKSVNMEDLSLPSIDSKNLGLRPLPIVSPHNPPSQPSMLSMNIINYRQCSPVAIPGVYNPSQQQSQARNPVIRVYSTNNPGQALYTVNPGLVRTVLFEKVLQRQGDGKFELLSQPTFQLNLTQSIVDQITADHAQGKTIVVSVEDLDSNHLFGSTVGLPGHGPVPTPPHSIPSYFLNPMVSSLPNNLAVMQLGTMLKTSHGNPGDDECDGEGDPLVIDFSNSGFRMTAANTYFDLANSGIVERFGWIAPNSSQGFLALDLNNNGKIDSGSELFSNYMSVSNNMLATNGFEALKSFDRQQNGGNNDGLIDNRDSVFSRLMIWLDKNSNGRTESGELIRLSSSGVESINTDYVIDVKVDQFGNKIIGESVVRMRNGSTRPIADLWFNKQTR